MIDNETLEQIDRLLVPYLGALHNVLEKSIKPEITVEVPEIKIPEILIPEPKIPPVVFPEIKIPEIRIPDVIVPEPKISLNVDHVKIENWPEFPDPVVFDDTQILKALKRLENKTGGTSGPTEYRSGNAYSSNSGVFGVAAMWEDASSVMRTISAANPLPVDIGAATVTATVDLDANNDEVTVYGSQAVALQQKVTTNDLIVTLDGESVAVTGTFWQATQPVSGTFWQATQPVSLDSVPSHAVTNVGTFAVQVDGAALTALQLIDNFISGARGLVTEDNSAAIKTAVEALDNSVDGNYLNVNLNMAGTDAAANAGAIGATTQRVVQAYNTDWITLRVNYTAAQTNISMITAAASEKIIVKSLDVMSDHACTVDVAVLIGFDDTTTPTGADCILSHPGIAAGSGVSKYYGSDGVTGATAADDLKITSEVPTDGSISIVIIYKIISV